MSTRGRRPILGLVFSGANDPWRLTPFSGASLKSSYEVPPLGNTAQVAAAPGEEMHSYPEATRNSLPSVLTTSSPALPPDLLNRTETLPVPEPAWWERILTTCRVAGLARRSRDCRRAWAVFRRAPHFDAVITDGATLGFLFACLQFLRGRRRPVHVMYDCYWYGGNWLRRAVMRFCLRQVDLCVVWTRVECVRYAQAYGVPPSKFAFVRHHHTLKRYRFEIAEGDYIFAGGNSDRDFGLLFDAIRDLPIPCVLATNFRNRLKNLQIPASVRVINASASEFRQLMAGARVVVVPMRANLLRTGGQQTFLNAMCMSKPTVLTDVEGGTDYIENGRTGLLVPYGDAGALRHAIEWLWSNPEEARSLGRRGCEVAVPLTTERCNLEIWSHAFDLVRRTKSPGSEKGQKAQTCM